jgi:hypothetical protein
VSADAPGELRAAAERYAASLATSEATSAGLQARARLRRALAHTSRCPGACRDGCPARPTLHCTPNV